MTTRIEGPRLTYGINIRIYESELGGWWAIDDDTYDGAPDSATRNQIGMGATIWDAARNLIELLEEAEQ